MNFFSHYDDERDSYEEDRQMDEEGVTCNRCGESAGLSWVHIGAQQWRLMDEDGKIHYCKPNADDFEDL